MKKITEGELADLLKDRYCLRCLVENGVDSWEGYEEALNKGVALEGTYWEYSSQNDKDITFAYDTI